MLLQQVQPLTEKSRLQQRRGGVNATGVIKRLARSRGLAAHGHHRGGAGEIVGQRRRAHERHLSAVRARQLGDFFIVGADHHLSEQAPSRWRFESSGQSLARRRTA